MKKTTTLFAMMLLAKARAFAFRGSGSGTSVDPYLDASSSLLNEVRNDLAAFYKQIQEITVSNICQHRACPGVIVATVTFTAGDIKGYTPSSMKN